jgi:CubicO group peptidase (beta-lactamase class C family)
MPRPRREPFRSIEKRIGTEMGKLVSWLPSPFNTRRMINSLAPRGIEEALWGPDAMDAAIPAANGFFTARSLAKMYGALACGGEIDGVRLVSEKTVHTMQVPRGRGPDLVLVMPMQWRLGYHRVFTRRGSLPMGFGHFGFGGSGGWADPSRELSLAMVCSRGTGTPVGDLRIMELGAAAVECADRIAAAP